MAGTNFLGIPVEIRVMVYKLAVQNISSIDHGNLMLSHPQIASEILAYLPQTLLSPPRYIIGDTVLENLVEVFEFLPRSAELEDEIAKAAQSFEAYVRRYNKVELIIAPSCQCIFKQPLAYRKGSVLDELEIDQDSAAHDLNLLVEDSALSFFKNTGGQSRDDSGWMGIGVAGDVMIRVDWEMSSCADEDDCEDDWEPEDEDELVPCAIRRFGCLSLEEKLGSETDFMEKLAWALCQARRVKKSEAEKKEDIFQPEAAHTIKLDDSSMDIPLPQKSHRN